MSEGGLAFVPTEGGPALLLSFRDVISVVVRVAPSSVSASPALQPMSASPLLQTSNNVPQIRITMADDPGGAWASERARWRVHGL